MAEPNDYDRAARFLAKSDPTRFFGWALGLRPADFQFVRWLDTRTIGTLGLPDRTGDTVGYLAELTASGRPWAVPLEFQAEPDHEMFGRLLEYLGRLWRTEKPSPERGDWIWVGAVVVNLTGTGHASRTMEWPAARLTTTLQLVERNLGQESATDTLAAISAGTTGRVVLPFVPLMQGGAEPAVIQKWAELAMAAPDSRRVGEYGSLARVFAQRTPGWADWEVGLKEWNVTKSPVVEEWRAEGRAEARTEAILEILETRFQAVPADLAAAIRGVRDLGVLKRWTSQAAVVASLDQFRAETGL